MAGLPFLTDGVTFNQIPPAAVAFAGDKALPSLMVGTAAQGVPGVPYAISTAKDIATAFGAGNPANANDLVTHLTLYLQACADMRKTALIYAVRATDGTDTAATIVIKDTQGTPGDSIKFIAKSTGSGLNGGTAQLFTVPGYATGQNVYNLILRTPSGVVEQFTGLIGYAGSTPAYSASTFLASIMAAVNSGQNLNRAASAYWTAVAPATQSTTAPALTAFAATGGADGSGVATSALIGTDGLSNRTGVYAGSGLGVAQVLIAGFSDVTAAAALTAFAVREKAVAVMSLPAGTTTTDALTSKQTNNLSSTSLVLTMDYLNWFDTTQGKLRLVAPGSTVLGIIASTAPEESPGNKPQYGLSAVNSTERRDNPLSDTEQRQRTQAGITWIGPLPRNRALLGLVNGQNSSASPGVDGINYTRTTNYIAAYLPLTVGFLVDALQSRKANDDTRKLAADAINGFLSGMNIDSFKVQCDLLNNSIPSINAGYLIIDVWVTYKGVARFIQLNVQGGVGVQITDSTAQVPQAA